MALAFKSAATGKIFNVVTYDQETGEMVLKGPHGTFSETYSKEKFKQMGYKPVQVEETPPADEEEDDDA